MDLHIQRDELIRGLGRAQGIVERRTTNQILSHVLLSARGDNLRLTATDLHHTLVADHPARVVTEGELSVDASTLFQIVRALTEPTVQLTLSKGNRLTIVCGKARFNVVGTSGEEFPPVPSRDDQSSLTVRGGDLRRMIEETLFSISTDDSRFDLNGAHLEEITAESGEPRLRLVTTDGSRLSWSESTYEGEFAMGRSMLLPRKGLGELRKFIEVDDTAWKVAFGDRSATFSTEGTTLMVRLVEGQFPPYHKVMPQGLKRRVVLQRSAFASALKRVSIMASDRNHSVRFAFEEDRLVLTAQNIDAGDVREEIPADLEGAPVLTGFNVRYFQDVLSATRSEQLQLELGEALDPCLVRMPDRDDCLFVVMPMRLD